MGKELGESKTFRQITLVASGNIGLLLAKTVVWFFVPKILGLNGYGYYKLFMMYMAYTALLHFGYPDGVLLNYAGKRIEELDQECLGTETIFFLVFEGIIGILFWGVGFIFFSDNIFFLTMLAVNMYFSNITTYYRYLSQATMHFYEFTIRNYIQAVLQILIVIIFAILKKWYNISISGEIYIACIVAINVFIFLRYFISYLDLLSVKHLPLIDAKNSIKRLFISGIVLTISYEVSNLVFILDSQMVSFFFDIKVYAVYAFAYSAVSYITQTVSAVSTVIFPGLKRLGEDRAIERYEETVRAVFIFVFTVLVSYFPIKWLVIILLPDYSSTERYLRIIMPGVALSCCINLILFTYYKVIGKVRIFLFQSLVALALAMCLNSIGYVLYRQPESFSVASVITMLIWYFISQRYFIKQYHVKWKKNTIYLIIVMAMFYCSVYMINNDIMAAIAYVLGIVIITIGFYGINLIDWIRR